MFYKAETLKVKELDRRVRHLVLLGLLLGSGGIAASDGGSILGNNTTLGNGDVAEELVKFLVVAEGNLDVTGGDAGLLAVAGGVASEFEDFGDEVLKDGGEVDGGSGTNTVDVGNLAHGVGDTGDGEHQTGAVGAGAGSLASNSGRDIRGLLATFAASHFRKM